MGICLLFYKLLLEKESMHVFKRCYLILALVASLVIPSLVFVEYIAPVYTSYEFTQDLNTTQFVTAPKTPKDIDVINWTLMAWTIYGIGATIFGIRFFRNLFQIFNRIRKNTKLKQRFSIKVLLLDQLPPHTFFRYIFLNKEKFETNTIPNEVLLHEEIHAKQCHSIDVIFIELLQVILWFNPFIFFFKKCIKLNHEFLADSAVIKEHISTRNYQNTLLSYLSKDSVAKYQSVKMANAINYSSIKKRFKVMKTQTSRKAVLLRIMLLLPLLASMLYGFSETKTIEKINPEIEHNKEELEKIDQLQVNYPDGATEKMMLEYKSFIKKYEKTNSINHDEYLRSIAIYDIMNETQKKSVKKYPEFSALSKGPKKQTLANSDFEAYKNNEKYAVWMDGKVIDNKVLNEYNASDFVYHSSSYVYHNARSTRFPQEYQVNLYTKRGFENTFNKKEANSQELAKYNILAEKYNEMSRDAMRISIKDVEQLKHIYSLMSDKQKADAEPFPNLPEPPPAPHASNAREQVSNKVSQIIKEQDPYDVVGKSIVISNSSPEYFKAENSTIAASKETPEQNNNKPKTGFLEVNGETIFYVSKKGNNTYYNRRGQKVNRKGEIISKEQVHAAEIIEGQVISKVYKDNKVVVEFNTDNVSISPPLPPLPPEPIEPLDFIITMAKKEADFYYEGKKINSDKAIELFKKNKSLNINSSGINSKAPWVKITKKPIKIGSIQEKKILKPSFRRLFV
jgi:hypothetical protein